MVQVLNTDGDRVILRLTDGTIMFVYDKYLQLKAIPGRKRTETKTMEYNDLLIMNDAIRRVYPECPQVLHIKAGSVSFDYKPEEVAKEISIALKAGVGRAIAG